MNDESSSYIRIRERLEEIVVQIRSKDVPLEKSLDLYEEALRLGSMAAEMIDNTDFGDDEMAAADSMSDVLDESTSELMSGATAGATTDELLQVMAEALATEAESVDIMISEAPSTADIEEALATTAAEAALETLYEEPLDEAELQALYSEPLLGDPLLANQDSQATDEEEA
jgi:exodeoxyribonuclease VII small subunit